MRMLRTSYASTFACAATLYNRIDFIGNLAQTTAKTQSMCGDLEGLIVFQRLILVGGYLGIV
jgi:hypothetical protein